VTVGPPTGGSALETVALLTSTGAASPNGGCAPGWDLCAQSNGGDCCPDGFACGQSCTAIGATYTSIVAKETPGGAVDGRTVSFIGWMVIAGGLAAGAAMVLL
jgi:progranulin